MWLQRILKPSQQHLNSKPYLHILNQKQTYCFVQNWQCSAITNRLSECNYLPTGETWNLKLYLLIMRSIDWYVFQVLCETSRSLWFGSSLMRAEQEPDPRGRVWLDLFRADSKSSRSPPNWKSLDVWTKAAARDRIYHLNKSDQDELI